LPVGPPDGQLVSRSGKGDGPALAGPDGKPEGEKVRPIDLSARSVEARVLRSPVKNTLDELRAEGEVHVRQDPAKPGEKPTDILGDSLHMIASPQGNLLEVSGDLAQLRMDKIYIIGPQVNIDQSTNKAWVHGVGAMVMDSSTNFQGEALKQPVPLTVHWTRSMFFNGESAEFSGGIQAEQQTARLACQHLQVYFDRFISLKQGQGSKNGQTAKVKNLVCDRDVRSEDRVYEDEKGEKLKRYTFLKGHALMVSALEPDGNAPRKPAAPGARPANEGNEVHVSGPGAVRMVQRGGDDPNAPPGMPRAATSAKPAAPPSKPRAPGGKPGAKPGGKPAAGDPDELKLTYVVFQKRMDGNSRTNTAQFWEHVQVLNMPCDQRNYNQPIDLDVLLMEPELPEGAMYLKCDRLKVLDQPENGKSNQQMEARGKVYVQSKNMYARAEAVFYNQAKNQIILDGAGGQASLYKRPRVGAPHEQVTGTKIIYNQVTGETDVQGGDGLSGSSSPAPRGGSEPPAGSAVPPRRK
jgi:lipopolysaccharide export system protein LptA